MPRDKSLLVGPARGPGRLPVRNRVEHRLVAVVRLVVALPATPGAERARSVEVPAAKIWLREPFGVPRVA